MERRYTSAETDRERSISALTTFSEHITTPEEIALLDELNYQYHHNLMTEAERCYNAIKQKNSTERNRFISNSANRKKRGKELVDAMRDAADIEARKRAGVLLGESSHNIVQQLNIEDQDTADNIHDALLTIGQIDEDTWQPQPDEDGNQPRGLRDDLMDIISADDDPASATGDEVDDADAEDTETETSPEVMNSDLETAREAYTIATAARLRASGFWSRKKNKLNQAYLEARENYLSQLMILETRNFEEMLGRVDADDNEEFTPEQVKESLIQRLNERAQADNVNIKQSMVEQGGWFARRLDSYSNLTRKKKIMVGLGMAGVAMATGFGVGLVASGIGVAGAVGAAGFGAASRFGRTFAIRLSRIYEQNNISNFTPADIDSQSGEEILNKARSWLQVNMSERIESADSTKRRAVYCAMGSVAIGGTAAVAHEFVDMETTSEFINKLRSIVSDIKKNINIGDGGSDIDTPDVDAPPPETMPPPSFNECSLTIDNGEGWYQTFKDLGIPREHWNQLLNETGPRLQELGIAYEDPSIGGYGINMTPDGRMPVEALQQITQAAQEHGYIVSPEYLEAPDTYDNATPEQVESDYDLDNSAPDEHGFMEHEPGSGHGDHAHYDNFLDDGSSGSDIAHGSLVSEAAQQIVHGEGWFQTFKELGVGREHWEQLLRESGPKLQRLTYWDGTKVAYFDSFHKEWRMNMSSNGRLSPRAIHLIADISRSHSW